MKYKVLYNLGLFHNKKYFKGGRMKKIKINVNGVERHLKIHQDMENLLKMLSVTEDRTFVPDIHIQAMTLDEDSYLYNIFFHHLAIYKDKAKKKIA